MNCEIAVHNKHCHSTHEVGAYAPPIVGILIFVMMVVFIMRRGGHKWTEWRSCEELPLIEKRYCKHCTKVQKRMRIYK